VEMEARIACVYGHADERSAVDLNNGRYAVCSMISAT
jgi:hypothetical protein